MKNNLSIAAYLPPNEVIVGNGNMSNNDIVKLLRKYKSQPEAIQFIADMLEE